MTGCGYIVDADGKPVEATPDEADAARPGAKLVWIHLDGRDRQAMDWLHASDLPPTVVALLTAVETRPRVDLIGEGAFLNLRGLAIDDADAPDGLVSIRLWADAGRVISVSFVRLAAIQPVREKMAAGRIRDPGDLITAMAVTITLALDPEVAKLGDTLDDCEADLVPGVGLEMRHLIGKTRAQAIRYRRFVAPQREALDRLSRLEVPWLEEEDRIHVRAAADRFARMAEELEAVRERAALMHEQLTDLRAEQIDQRTLLLSIAALIFLPLTFITGLLGMNVEGIPYAHHPHAFWWVTAFCITVAVGVAGWFVRAHWLKG
jgi:zinc transporter